MVFQVFCVIYFAWMSLCLSMVFITTWWQHSTLDDKNTCFQLPLLLSLAGFYVWYHGWNEVAKLRGIFILPVRIYVLLCFLFGYFEGKFGAGGFMFKYGCTVISQSFCASFVFWSSVSSISCYYWKQKVVLIKYFFICHFVYWLMLIL